MPKSTKAAMESVEVRGNQFIKGAILILDNSGIELGSEEYERVKGLLEKQAKGLNSEALEKNKHVKADGDKGLQSVLAGINKQLLETLQEQVPSLKGIGKHDLLNAESHTNWQPRTAVVSVMDPSGKLIGRSNPDGGFETVGAYGEVTAAYKTEAELKEALRAKHPTIAIRKENPITAFTPEQTESWGNILKTPSGEDWF
ncbi:MAG: hypothetical protein HOI53_04480, partial [Francisellaceae bacterium]|nr:hypothetical protein [Francisellaceae bacterium]